MQLATIYCEKDGGVHCTNKSLRSPIKSSNADNTTSPKKIMSCSNERKRKHLHNSSKSEHDPTCVAVEHGTHQKNFVKNSCFIKEGSECDTVKKMKSRKIRHSSKSIKNKSKEVNASENNSPNDKDNESESDRSNGTTIDESDSQIDQKTVSESESTISEHEIESQGMPSEQPINIGVGREEASILQERKEEFANIQKERLTTRSEQSGEGVDNILEKGEISLKMLVHENDEKNSTIDNLNEVADDSIVDDNKTNSNRCNDSSFIAQNHCKVSLYHIKKAELSASVATATPIDESPVSIDEKQIFRKFDNTSELNENDIISTTDPPVDGCTKNSSAFSGITNEAVTTDCKILNVSTADREKDKILDQEYEYKDSVELEKGFTENEENISVKSWEAISQNSRFENAELICFRTTPSHNSTVDINQRNSQLQIYGTNFEHDYNVHAQQRLSERFTNNTEVTARKSETEERHEQQIQPEQYRQFQHNEQQPLYEQILEAHRREQQHQMQTQQTQHQQQHQHQPQQYPQEFYQMRIQQQHHHLASVMPMMPQLHQNLQDPVHDENFMAYSHHQHSVIPITEQHNRLQQDIYHNLIMDEFHEEANPSGYKLRPMSPTTKHENQDDGYETSAGDVLTPNSHSSSTHSGTPQLSGSLHVPTSALALQSVPTPKCGINSQPSQMHSLQCLSPENYKQDATSLNNDIYNRFRGDSSGSNNEKYVDQNTDRIFPIQQDQQQSSQNQNPPSQNIHHDSPNTMKTEFTHMLGDSSEVLLKPPQKRRGRKKKLPLVDGMPIIQSITDNSETGTGSTPILKVKERKKHDRFNGMTEEEVVKRTLPDHLCHSLDIVIIGINPGLFAAYKGHHYAGPGNHFWKCLYLSGLTQEQMNADEDFKLMKSGIGFTNMVQRATKGSADLTRKEIKEGSRILLEKLQRFQPKIAVFNGKLIFEVFSGKKDFNFGRQPEYVEGTNTYVWVMPSSSARCAQLPRAADKVPFYAALKKFKDYLNGMVSHIDEEECVFTEQRIRQMCEQEQLKSLVQSQIACGYNNAADGTTESLKPQEQGNMKIQKGDYTLFSPSDNQLDPTTAKASGSTIGGPGPATILSQSGGFIVPPNFSTAAHQPPEKKKRGRPKKLRIQELIDPNTGQKIQISNQSQSLQHNSNTDYSNILNLSMMPGEAPKKKRGRPKKIKPLGADILTIPNGEAASIMVSNNTPQNSMSMQSLTVNNVLTQQTSQQHSLYTSPGNTNLQTQLYTGDCSSPIGSPAVNSKTGGTSSGSLYNNVSATPPINILSAQTTPPVNDSSVELAVNTSKQHLGESPPPTSSPNICAVDFEPPNSTESHQQETLDLHQRQISSLSQQQGGRFESSHINGIDESPNENFHQWISSSQHFNYQTSQQQDHHTQQYQNDQHLSMHLRQPPTHENNTQSQHSPHTSWATPQRNQHFDTNEVNQQQPQYLMHHHHQQQQQQPPQQQQRQQQQQQHQEQQDQQCTQLPHQTIQHSSDVSTKSLSGLESLVDQIPTIAESEAAAAAVESRLQALQRVSTPNTIGELHNESYTGSLHENRAPNCLGSTTSLTEVTNDTTTSGRNSSNGSNTPHYGMNGGTSCASPITNYVIQRQNQTTSAASSPHANSQYSSGVSSGTNFSLTNSAEHSSAVSREILVSSNTPPMTASSCTTTTNSNSTTTSHLFSNFSVSHLAASSCNNSSNNKSGEWPTSASSSPYHHPNLMAAAALQLHSAAAASSSPTGNPPHQMYIEHPSIHHHPHHTHLSTPHQHHVQVNSLYSPAAQGSHGHHHPGMSVAYGSPHVANQHPSHHLHNAGSEYGSYGATAAAAAAHMLHMPNPNYSPYGYGTPPPPPVPTATTQSNYSSWNHHHHPSAPNHHPHHLAMFERLKPSDIGSYSSF